MITAGRHSQYSRELVFQYNESQHLHPKNDRRRRNGSEERNKTDSLRALTIAYSRARTGCKSRRGGRRHDEDAAKVRGFIETCNNVSSAVARPKIGTPGERAPAKLTSF